MLLAVSYPEEANTNYVIRRSKLFGIIYIIMDLIKAGDHHRSDGDGHNHSDSGEQGESDRVVDGDAYELI